MQTRGKNNITKYGLSRTDLVRILPSSLFSHEILDTLVVLHDSSMFSWIEWRCFCFKELLVHVKDSACAIYCMAHIVGPSLMKAWAPWSVGCYSFAARVVAFRLGFSPMSTVIIVEQKKLVREESRSRVWGQTRLKEHFSLPEDVQTTFSGYMRELAGQSMGFYRNNDRVQKEEQVMGIITVGGFFFFF